MRQCGRVPYALALGFIISVVIVSRARMQVLTHKKAHFRLGILNPNFPTFIRAYTRDEARPVFAPRYPVSRISCYPASVSPYPVSCVFHKIVSLIPSPRIPQDTRTLIPYYVIRRPGRIVREMLVVADERHGPAPASCSAALSIFSVKFSTCVTG